MGLDEGAALISLTTTFPQPIWLSEHKIELFVIAGLILVVAGVFQHRASAGYRGSFMSFRV